MAEAWVEIHKVREHLKLLEKTMGYFRIECLSFAVVDLIRYSHRRSFGVFRRTPLTFTQANEIVSTLHLQGASRPRWCTGPWPNDLRPDLLGICSEYEAEALRRLCDESPTRRIRMDEDQMMRITAYRDLQVRMPESLAEFMAMDVAEFREKAEEYRRTIREKERAEEGTRRGAEGAFSHVKSTVDTFMTGLVALVLTVFTAALRHETIALFTGFLAFVAFLRFIHRMRAVSQRRDSYGE